MSILEEQVNLFEKLFTSEGWDSDSAAYLLNNLEKKLSQEDKEICDEGITLDEISKAVKLQKPDKSPGDDGIVSEFYRHYWYLIGEDFESMVREILDQKLLSESQNRGIITYVQIGGKGGYKKLEAYYSSKRGLQNCVKNISRETKTCITKYN